MRTVDGISTTPDTTTAPHPHMQAGLVVASKYRLVRELGRGGMGAVWEATHETLGRTVAVKFLTPQQNDASLAQRFVSEARMVATIKHRFVIDVFDFGVTDDGLYYMVLELLDGVELSEHMDGGPAFPVRDGVKLIADCLKGLDAVHAKGVVHRDLKPENVFVVHDSDGAFPKLIDFGISKRAELAIHGDAEQPRDGRKSRLTAPGMLIGTPSYMSPEQLRGRGNVDARADVFSMGVILYELLGGCLPCPEDNVADLMVSIVSRSAPTLFQLRPELGKTISDVVARAMEPEVDKRYPSANALREALVAAVPSLPEGAMTALQKDAPDADGAPGRTYGKRTELQFKSATDPFGSAEESAKKQRVRMIGIAVACVVLLGGLALWLGKSAPAPTSTSQADHAAQVTAATAAPAAAALPPPAAAPSAATVAQPVAQEPAPQPAPAPAVKSTTPAAPAHHAAATPKPAATHAPSARPKATPKVFHKLDF